MFQSKQEMSKLPQEGRLTAKLIIIIIIIIIIIKNFNRRSSHGHHCSKRAVVHFCSCGKKHRKQVNYEYTNGSLLKPRVFGVRSRIRRVVPGTGRQHVTGPTNGDQRYHFIFLLEEMKHIRGIREYRSYLNKAVQDIIIRWHLQ